MKRIRKFLICMLVLSVCIGTGFWLFAEYAEYGFAREVALKEKELRQQVVATASEWVGTREGFAGHEKIIQTYNAHQPLAQNYEVTTSDNWCAAFASTVAIQCELTDIIPTECGCQRQIGLWQDMNRWEENDLYIPLPGDYIYYAWDEGWNFGDCTGWADHVGIVVGTVGPFIKVIEGNWNDRVTYRVILRSNMEIRGYGLPDYSSKAEEKTAG